MRLFTRAIRPPDDVTPNPNPPESVPPATVGPPSAVPGDPHGITVEGPTTPATPPPRIVPSPWSGWPADWYPPMWGNGRAQELTDTAWNVIDTNANILATMPPYLVGSAPSLSADWLNNPDPEQYQAWEEFAKQLFWDFQLGEAFVYATARYATGWPARFHVVPPWLVDVDFDGAGRRRYRIGKQDVSDDMLHIRYQSSTGDARGHGPLEAAVGRLVASRVLDRYVTMFASSGGIPSSILKHPEQLSPEQAAVLQQQWVAARTSTLGEPAVLSGGIQWEPVQANPTEMGFLDLRQANDSRIAYMLGMPAFLVGLPSGADSLTYNTVVMALDMHWRMHLRPRAQIVMTALSGWLLPRGTRVEVNRDAYVQPEPLQRAQTAEILNRIRDDQGNPALTVAEIRASERLDNSSPQDLASGVLR